MLISCLLLHQPDWAWPLLSDCPWMSTSIIEYWSFCWHQFFQCMFVIYGAHTGGMLLGKPGTCIGTFAVFRVLHDVGLWGLRCGMEFWTMTRFFMLMGVSGMLELGFKWLMGRHVGRFCGWVWTMVWTIGWGTLMIDRWAQQGIVVSDFFPNRHQPGKWLINTIIALLSEW
jgi:hypothetical protein